jgi:hypothetical protein
MPHSFYSRCRKERETMYIHKFLVPDHTHIASVSMAKNYWIGCKEIRKYNPWFSQYLPAKSTS